MGLRATRPVARVHSGGRSHRLRLLERLELHLYSRARAVVCVTEAFIQNLRRRGVDGSKLHFVPNGIVPAMWEGGSREEGRARLRLARDEVAVSYIGTLGMAHGLGTVLDAARLLQGTKARFLIVGDGAERMELEARTAAYGLSNVTFTGLLPRSEIVHLMAATDVALVTLKPSDTFKTVLPSKMFEAMAARRPIVLAVDGEAKSVLERSGGGIAVPPGNAEALAGAIDALVGDPDRREALGAAGGAFVRREFDREVWAGRYLAILKGLAAQSVSASGSVPLRGQGQTPKREQTPKQAAQPEHQQL
jgi:glycosyltransferase involved in cell wall biosynthesis